MYILKAFASNDLFVSNDTGVVSAIGELSTLASTYSKEKGLYKSSLSANINLTAFKSAIFGVPFVMTVDLVDDTISIIKHIYNNAASGLIQQTTYLTDLMTTFSSIATNFSIGNAVTVGNKTVPEWVSWESKNITTIGTGNLVKVWLSDPAFRSQYDEYELVIVPPITNLDNFFTPAANVLTVVSAVKQDVLISNVQAAKNGYPETLLVAKIYNYVDPVAPTNLIPTVWNILIYGVAGNNDIIIQNALIQYILANSTKVQNLWSPLIPDIFKHTEFSIIPEWKQYAIPNRTLEAGIYSPIVSIQDAINNLNAVVTAYPANHIATYASVMSQPYKSLTLLVVGSPDNKNFLFKIKDIFPDYIDVSSTSIDFTRMSQKTQDWATLMNNMIVLAETITINSSVPAGMSKVARGNILYIVSRFDNVDYLIATKASFP